MTARDEGGLIFLRDRYYNPALGRFMSRDPLLGLPITPSPLNRHTYVRNNPSSQVDPSGLCGQASNSEVAQATALCQQQGWNACDSITPGMAHDMLHGDAQEVDWSDPSSVLQDGSPADWGLFALSLTAGGGDLRALASGAAPVKTALHHIFPQRADLAAIFSSVGIDIHELTVRLPVPLHKAVHQGSPRGGAYLEAWRNLFDAKPGATQQEIFQKASELIRELGIDGRPVQRYE